MGIAAAFLFDVKEDAQSVELLAFVKEHGIREAIAKYTGIQEGSETFEKIAGQYERLKEK